MDKIIVTIVGALCGVGQFLLLRYTLKPLAQGKDPQMAKVMLWRIPIPLVFLLGCAFINPALLPFGGGAFCLGLIIATIISHLATPKGKG